MSLLKTRVGSVFQKRPIVSYIKQPLPRHSPRSVGIVYAVFYFGLGDGETSLVEANEMLILVFGENESTRA